MDIDFITMPTEELNFPDNTFDVITACQCFWYFNHETVIPNLARMLKPDGRLLILYMAWLPFEDEIAGKSEELVLIVLCIIYIIITFININNLIRA